MQESRELFIVSSKLVVYGCDHGLLLPAEYFLQGGSPLQLCRWIMFCSF